MNDGLLHRRGCLWLFNSRKPRLYFDIQDRNGGIVFEHTIEHYLTVKRKNSDGSFSIIENSGITTRSGEEFIFEVNGNSAKNFGWIIKYDDGSPDLIVPSSDKFIYSVTKTVRVVAVIGVKVLLSDLKSGTNLSGLTIYFDTSKNFFMSTNLMNENYRLSGENGYYLDYVRSNYMSGGQRVYYTGVEYINNLGVEISPRPYNHTNISSSNFMNYPKWGLDCIKLTSNFGNVKITQNVGDFWSSNTYYPLTFQKSDTWMFI